MRKGGWPPFADGWPFAAALTVSCPATPNMRGKTVVKIVVEEVSPGRPWGGALPKHLLTAGVLGDRFPWRKSRTRSFLAQMVVAGMAAAPPRGQPETEGSGAGRDFSHASFPFRRDMAHE